MEVYEYSSKDNSKDSSKDTCTTMTADSFVTLYVIY